MILQAQHRLVDYIIFFQHLEKNLYDEIEGRRELTDDAKESAFFCTVIVVNSEYFARKVS